MYKHSLDLIFYIIGDPAENELMLHAALVAFSDAVYMLLRNQVEKRGVLENLDLVLLCLDETIDDGYACSFVPFLIIIVALGTARCSCLYDAPGLLWRPTRQRSHPESADQRRTRPRS